LLSERYEAERKRIEAIGIQTFYSIVSESLNDTLLTRRAIEATIDLSRSPNTKVIVVGGNREQMPLILGSDITQQPATPSPLPQVSPQSQPTLPDFDQLPPLFPDQPGQSLSAPSVDADVGLDSAPTRTRLTRSQAPPPMPTSHAIALTLKRCRIGRVDRPAMHHDPSMFGD